MYISKDTFSIVCLPPNLLDITLIIGRHFLILNIVHFIKVVYISKLYLLIVEVVIEEKL